LAGKSSRIAAGFNWVYMLGIRKTGSPGESP